METQLTKIITKTRITSMEMSHQTQQGMTQNVVRSINIRPGVAEPPKYKVVMTPTGKKIIASHHEQKMFPNTNVTKNTKIVKVTTKHVTESLSHVESYDAANMFEAIRPPLDPRFRAPIKIMPPSDHVIIINPEENVEDSGSDSEAEMSPEMRTAVIMSGMSAQTNIGKAPSIAPSDGVIIINPEDVLDDSESPRMSPVLQTRNNQEFEEWERQHVIEEYLSSEFDDLDDDDGFDSDEREDFGNSHEMEDTPIVMPRSSVNNRFLREKIEETTPKAWTPIRRPEKSRDVSLDADDNVATNSAIQTPTVKICSNKSPRRKQMLTPLKDNSSERLFNAPLPPIKNFVIDSFPDGASCDDRGKFKDVEETKEKSTEFAIDPIGAFLFKHRLRGEETGVNLSDEVENAAQETFIATNSKENSIQELNNSSHGDVTSPQPDLDEVNSDRGESGTSSDYEFDEADATLKHIEALEKESNLPKCDQSDESTEAVPQEIHDNATELNCAGASSIAAAGQPEMEHESENRLLDERVTDAESLPDDEYFETLYKAAVEEPIIEENYANLSKCDQNDDSTEVVPIPRESVPQLTGDQVDCANASSISANDQPEMECVSENRPIDEPVTDDERLSDDEYFETLYEAAVGKPINEKNESNHSECSREDDSTEVIPPEVHESVHELTGDQVDCANASSISANDQPEMECVSDNRPIDEPVTDDEHQSDDEYFETHEAAVEKPINDENESNHSECSREDDSTEVMPPEVHDSVSELNGYLVDCVYASSIVANGQPKMECVSENRLEPVINAESLSKKNKVETNKAALEEPTINNISYEDNVVSPSSEKVIFSEQEENCPSHYKSDELQSDSESNDIPCSETTTNFREKINSEWHNLNICLEPMPSVSNELNINQSNCLNELMKQNEERVLTTEPVESGAKVDSLSKSCEENITVDDGDNNHESDTFLALVQSEVNEATPDASNRIVEDAVDDSSQKDNASDKEIDKDACNEDFTEIALSVSVNKANAVQSEDVKKVCDSKLAPCKNDTIESQEAEFESKENQDSITKESEVDHQPNVIYSEIENDISAVESDQAEQHSDYYCEEKDDEPKKAFDGDMPKFDQPENEVNKSANESDICRSDSPTSSTLVVDTSTQESDDVPDKILDQDVDTESDFSVEFDELEGVLKAVDGRKYAGKKAPAPVLIATLENFKEVEDVLKEKPRLAASAEDKTVTPEGEKSAPLIRVRNDKELMDADVRFEDEKLLTFISDEELRQEKECIRLGEGLIEDDEEDDAMVIDVPIESEARSGKSPKEVSTAIGKDDETVQKNKTPPVTQEPTVSSKNEVTQEIVMAVGHSLRRTNDNDDDLVDITELLNAPTLPEEGAAIYKLLIEEDASEAVAHPKKESKKKKPSGSTAAAQEKSHEHHNKDVLARHMTCVDCDEKICPECFVSCRNVWTHFNRGSQRLRCGKCDLMLNCVCSLEAHSRLHTISPPFVCPECGVVYHNAKFLFLHLQKKCMHLNRAPRYSCDRCAAVMSSRADLLTHFKTHITPLFECRLCKKQTIIRETAHRHALKCSPFAVDEGDIFQYINLLTLCEICGQVVGRFYGNHLRSHANKIESSGNMLLCPCGHSSDSRAKFKSHMKECSRVYDVQSWSSTIADVAKKRPKTMETYECNTCETILRAPRPTKQCASCREKHGPTAPRLDSVMAEVVTDDKENKGSELCEFQAIDYSNVPIDHCEYGKTHDVPKAIAQPARTPVRHIKIATVQPPQQLRQKSISPEPLSLPSKPQLMSAKQDSFRCPFCAESVPILQDRLGSFMTHMKASHANAVVPIIAETSKPTVAFPKEQRTVSILKPPTRLILNPAAASPRPKMINLTELIAQRPENRPRRISILSPMKTNPVAAKEDSLDKLRIVGPRTMKTTPPAPVEEAKIMPPKRRMLYVPTVPKPPTEEPKKRKAPSEDDEIRVERVVTKRKALTTRITGNIVKEVAPETKGKSRAECVLEAYRKTELVEKKKAVPKEQTIRPKVGNDTGRRTSRKDANAPGDVGSLKITLPLNKPTPAVVEGTTDAKPLRKEHEVWDKFYASLKSAERKYSSNTKRTKRLESQDSVESVGSYFSKRKVKKPKRFGDSSEEDEGKEEAEEEEEEEEKAIKEEVIDEEYDYEEVVPTKKVKSSPKLPERTNSKSDAISRDIPAKNKDNKNKESPTTPPAKSSKKTKVHIDPDDIRIVNSINRSAESSFIQKSFQNEDNTEFPSNKRKRKLASKLMYLKKIGEDSNDFSSGRIISNKHSSDKPSSDCAICKLSFKTLSELRSHIISHKTDENSYQCMECGECFVVRPSLEKHLHAFHKIKDIPKYISENCPSQEPIDSPVPEEMDEPENEKECRVCHVVLPTVAELNKHFRTHGMAFLKSKKLV